MIFTSRAPRDIDEIETCVAMLEDSPLFDKEYRFLHRSEVVKAWEILLTTGQGYIDITEHEGYARQMSRRTKPRRSSHDNPAHKFFTCYYIVYVTRDFAREIIAGDDIADLSWHFLQRYIEHLRNPSLSSPAATVEEMLKGHRQEPGYGLYSFQFAVVHPEINMFQPSMLFDMTKYTKRLRRSTEQYHGGLAHHAWINNIAHASIMEGHKLSGNRLLREYSSNRDKKISEKKYVLCLTKDKQVSDDLGVPSHIRADLNQQIGNWFSYFFHEARVKANLTSEQQKTCYLLMLGYSQMQIAHTLFPNSQESIEQRLQRVRFYQNKAAERLEKAGYPVSGGKREQIQNVISNNMHEVRSIISPLYPWPNNLFLPD